MKGYKMKNPRTGIMRASGFMAAVISAVGKSTPSYRIETGTNVKLAPASRNGNGRRGKFKPYTRMLKRKGGKRR